MSDYDYNDADPAATNGDGGYNSGAGSVTGADPAPNSYAELEEMPTELPSSSALDAFMEQWEQKLEAKRQIETDKRTTVLSKATAELSKFNEEREVMREKKQSNNRKEEQVKLEKLEADLEAENPWERVVNLVDMQADVAPGKCDLARLKQIFIHLKNEPFASSGSEEGGGK